MGLKGSRNSKLGLWPRVALAISAGFIVLFLALALLVERALQDSVERRRDERLVIAQIAAGQIDNLIDQAISSLEQTSRLANTQPGPPDLTAIADSLEAKRATGLFSSGLFLLDSRGWSVSSHPPGLYPAGSDLSGLSHIARALDLEQVTISEPFQGPYDGQPVIAITVPLHKDGLIGLLTGLVNLSGDRMMTPLNQAADLGESEHAVLIDNQGRVVISTFSLPMLSPGEHHTFYRNAMAL